MKDRNYAEEIRKATQDFKDGKISKEELITAAADAVAVADANAAAANAAREKTRSAQADKLLELLAAA